MDEFIEEIDKKFLNWFYIKYPDEYFKYHKEWEKEGKPKIE